MTVIEKIDLARSIISRVDSIQNQLKSTYGSITNLLSTIEQSFVEHEADIVSGFEIAEEDLVSIQAKIQAVRDLGTFLTQNGFIEE